MVSATTMPTSFFSFGLLALFLATNERPFETREHLYTQTMSCSTDCLDPATRVFLLNFLHPSPFQRTSWRNILDHAAKASFKVSHHHWLAQTSKLARQKSTRGNLTLSEEDLRTVAANAAKVKKRRLPSSRQQDIFLNL